MCAGIVGVVGSITETPTDAFQRTMDIHCCGTFLGIKHGARVMGEGGSIVCMASTAGIIGGQGPHAYTMAKQTMEPPSPITLAPCLIPRKVPRQWMSIVRWKASVGVSVMEPTTPTIPAHKTNPVRAP